MENREEQLPVPGSGGAGADRALGVGEAAPAKVNPRKAARLREALARFECQRCGRCCEGQGTVRVGTEEVEAMAAALGLDPYAFTARYTRLAENRRDLVLLDREDDACIFLTPEGQCQVQSAKPRQCREFPWTWNYPGYEKVCAGMRAALAACRELAAQYAGK